MKSLKELVRPGVMDMKVHASAREKLDNKDSYIWLDKDENPYNSPYNRYPDAPMKSLKTAISKVKNVGAENVFVANGRNVLIDTLYRCFCSPGVDNVVVVEPTYNIYNVLADLNGVEKRGVLLDTNFQLSAERVIERCDNHTKLIWICTPNTPTGNAVNPVEIMMLLEMFDGIVVLDESYVDFSNQPSWRTQLGKFPNLVVLNTMDNSWACAAISIAMMFASSEIVDVLDKFSAPFYVNALSQKVALEQFRDTFEAEKRVRTVILERNRMIAAFRDLPLCEQVYPSETNFLLVKFTHAHAVAEYLQKRGIVVTDCTDIPLCENCLRITIGSKLENNELLSALRQY